MEKVYLILENGEIFEGINEGVKKETIGEVVFTTGMSGYLDTLTNPSHYGQIVVQTFPLIGNYGVIKESTDNKKVHLSGYVVKDICDIPSNFRSEGKLKDYLIDNQVVCISGIDTRKLTKIIREQGVMSGIITNNPVFLCEDKTKLSNYKIKDALASTAKDAYESKVPNATKKVVVINYGDCKELVHKLNKKGLSVQVVAHDTNAEDIMSIQADGIILSNGGGNPKDNAFEIDQIKKLVSAGVPILAIGLGHCMLALAMNGNIIKLKHGHYGLNIPVKNTQNSKIYVTTQNHLYEVDADSVKDRAELYFYNINNKTCEGLIYKDIRAISTQFEPTVMDGPMDTSFVYDKFVEIMGGKK